MSYSGQTYRSLVSSNGNTPSSSPSQWTLLYSIGGNTDITLRRGVLRNFFEYVFTSSGVYDSSMYWNADGLSSERNDKRITVEDVEVYDCTDGGFDMKAQDLVMRRCHSEGSKRNYRIWGDALLEDCSSTGPNKRGGSSSSVHFWFNDGGARLVRPQGRRQGLDCGCVRERGRRDGFKSSAHR